MSTTSPTTNKTTAASTSTTTNTLSSVPSNTGNSTSTPSTTSMSSTSSSSPSSSSLTSTAISSSTTMSSSTSSTTLSTSTTSITSQSSSIHTSSSSSSTSSTSLTPSSTSTTSSSITSSTSDVTTSFHTDTTSSTSSRTSLTTSSTTFSNSVPSSHPSPSPDISTAISSSFHPTSTGEATNKFSETTVTSIFTTTSNGQVVTITEVSVSQTLSPNNTGSKGTSFFQNTGAVAGVFVVVGLAAASIFLWILFALRRRRRTRRLEHDTAVSATLAAAGFHRTPLDDDDDDENVNGSRRFGSPVVNHRTSSGFASTIPSGARTSAYFDSPHPDDPDAFNPYRDYVVDAAAPAGSTPPPSAFYSGPYRNRTLSAEEPAHAHSASYEPLLASYYRQEAVSSPTLPAVANPPNIPPKNPLRLSDAGRSPPLAVLSKNLPPEMMPTSGESSVHTSASVGDDRLDPGLRHRMNVEADRVSQREFKDEEDYSRPVLGVRNLPSTSQEA